MLASLLFNAYMQVSFFSISTLLRSLFLSLSYGLALAPSLPFLLHHCLSLMPLFNKSKVVASEKY
jgi:hypothetical protein